MKLHTVIENLKLKKTRRVLHSRSRSWLLMVKVTVTITCNTKHVSLSSSWFEWNYIQGFFIHDVSKNEFALHGSAMKVKIRYSIQLADEHIDSPTFVFNIIQKRNLTKLQPLEGMENKLYHLSRFYWDWSRLVTCMKHPYNGIMDHYVWRQYFTNHAYSLWRYYILNCFKINKCLPYIVA